LDSHHHQSRYNTSLHRQEDDIVR